MGVLVVKKYPIKQFSKLADHTYVECGTGGQGWSCWGGKTGGKEYRRASGSTERSNKIADTNERARIQCYAVNGVCHQAANRILLPSGITARGARGYSVSEAIYGVYGRVGFWPCRSPFKKFPAVTKDLPPCIPAVTSSVSGAGLQAVSDTHVQRDWAYTRAVLALYEKGESITQPYTGATVDAQREVAKSVEGQVEAIHVEMFDLMVEFNLGPLYDSKLGAKLSQVRRATEKRILATQAEYGAGQLVPNKYGAAFDEIVEGFQRELAGVLSATEYRSLLDQGPEEPLVNLVDPRIIAEDEGLVR
jgi:hypothetical protein